MSETILIIIEMIGGLVLFLYGMDLMGDGLKEASGGKLEAILERLSGTRLKGILLGTVVTAVIQSSGATVVMCVGFVNSQIMTLNQALGVILGANIGSPVTAWLLSLTGIQGTSLAMSLLKPKYFSPIIGLIGLIMLMMGKKDRTRNIGNILVSLAVLLLGMCYMSDAATPLTEMDSFTRVLTAFSNPVLGVLIGAAVTVALQSSSASIGVLQAISMGGSLNMAAAIPIIMGANIGSSITGVLGAIGATRNGIRAAMLQMTYCVIKVGIFLLGFYSLNAFLHFGVMGQIATPFTIAIFHSVFNIVAVCVIYPFADVIVWIVMKMFPQTEEEKKELENRRTLQILDDRFLASPAFALDQSKVATNRMAEYTKRAMSLAMGLVFEYDDNTAKEVDSIERRVDEYEDKLGGYLVKLSRSPFSKKDSHTLNILLHCINDFERITDHALNIMQVAQEMHEQEMAFSPKAIEELHVFTDAVAECLDRAIGAFRKEDLDLALTVEPLEEVIDGLSLEIKRRHVRRMAKGKCSVEAGSALSDLTVDLERVADHCSNIAVTMLTVEDDQFDTHEYLEQERDRNNAEFIREENEFEAKYHFPKMKRDIEELAGPGETPKEVLPESGRTAKEALMVATADKKNKKKKKKNK